VQPLAGIIPYTAGYAGEERGAAVQGPLYLFQIATP